jgi:hypothetical protein
LATNAFFKLTVRDSFVFSINQKKLKTKTMIYQKKNFVTLNILLACKSTENAKRNLKKRRPSAINTCRHSKKAAGSFRNGDE